MASSRMSLKQSASRSVKDHPGSSEQSDSERFHAAVTESAEISPYASVIAPAQGFDTHSAVQFHL